MKSPNPVSGLGEFQNVILSEEELKKLRERFGERDTKRRIECLSEYMAAKRTKYISHYAVILMWARKNDRAGNGLSKSTAPKPKPLAFHCEACSPPHEWKCSSDALKWTSPSDRTIACPEAIERMKR